MSSKTTTTSDSGHTNGFLPNGGGSGGGVWTGETLSSLSGKSSSAASGSGDGDGDGIGSDDRFFSVDGYATGSRRLTAHARQQQQQRLQGRLAPPPAPPYRDARRGGEDLVPSSRFASIRKRRPQTFRCFGSLPLGLNTKLSENRLSFI